MEVEEDIVVCQRICGKICEKLCWTICIGSQIYSMMSKALSNEGNIKVFYRQLNIDRIN